MASGEMSIEEYVEFLTAGLQQCEKVSKAGAVHFVFIYSLHIEELLAAGRQVYDRRLSICTWNKTNAGMGGLYRNQSEFVCVFVTSGAAYYNGVQLGRHGRNRTNVWDYPSVNTFNAARREESELHPTVKPFSLVYDAILDVTRPGETVLDGYNGSGTTLVACERSGRIFRGVELGPRYVDVAVQRWMDLTGETAVNAETMEPFAPIKRRRVLHAVG